MLLAESLFSQIDKSNYNSIFEHKQEFYKNGFLKFESKEIFDNGYNGRLLELSYFSLNGIIEDRFILRIREITKNDKLIRIEKIVEEQLSYYPNGNIAYSYARLDNFLNFKADFSIYFPNGNIQYSNYGKGSIDKIYYNENGTISEKIFLEEDRKIIQHLYKDGIFKFIVKVDGSLDINHSEHTLCFDSKMNKISCNNEELNSISQNYGYGKYFLKKRHFSHKIQQKNNGEYYSTDVIIEKPSLIKIPFF